MMQQKVRKEKKTCFNVHFQYGLSKTTGLYVMWSVKSLSMLRCESRTSLHAVQYKWQPGTVLFFIIIILKMASLDTLFLYSVRQQAWLYPSFFLNFSAKIKAFVLVKLLLSKKSVNHFLVRLKPLLVILLFATFFRQHLLPFPKRIFLNALETECCLILPKILKTNGVLVSFLLTLNIFNTLF